VIKELFSEIGVFSREERVIYYDIAHSKDMENLQNDRKNVKNMVDD